MTVKGFGECEPAQQPAYHRYVGEIDADPEIAVVVLAAGAGSRFQGIKQLADFHGRPLLEHCVAKAVSANVGPVYVVLGFEAALIRDKVDFGAATVVESPSWSTGQAASLRAGLRCCRAQLGSSVSVMVLLGDQPLISVATIRLVAESEIGPATICQASYAGRPGHPVKFGSEVMAAAMEIDGDVGLRAIFGQFERILVPSAANGSDRDADTEEELAALARDSMGP